MARRQVARSLYCSWLGLLTYLRAARLLSGPGWTRLESLGQLSSALCVPHHPETKPNDIDESSVKRWGRSTTYGRSALQTYRKEWRTGAITTICHTIWVEELYSFIDPITIQPSIYLSISMYRWMFIIT